MMKKRLSPMATDAAAIVFAISVIALWGILSATRLVARVRAELGVEVPI